MERVENQGRSTRASASADRPKPSRLSRMSRTTFLSNSTFTADASPPECASGDRPSAPPAEARARSPAPSADRSRRFPRRPPAPPPVRPGPVSIRTLFPISLEMRLVRGKIRWQRIRRHHQILHPAPERVPARSRCPGLSQQPLADDFRLRDPPEPGRAGDLRKQLLGNFDRQRSHGRFRITVLPTRQHQNNRSP